MPIAYVSSIDYNKHVNIHKMYKVNTAYNADDNYSNIYKVL